MTTPIKRTSASQSTKSSNHTQNSTKPRKKVDTKTQSVFDEIEKNHKQADIEHDQFMQDMFVDVLSDTQKNQNSNSSKQPKTNSKHKKVNKNTQKALDEIEKNRKQADKEHEQFMKDMFGNVV